MIPPNKDLLNKKNMSNLIIPESSNETLNQNKKILNDNISESEIPNEIKIEVNQSDKNNE